MSPSLKVEEFALGRWVAHQRITQGRITPERKQRLDDIGFVWDPLTEDWEEGFANLLKFKEAEGHFDVSVNYKFDGYNLGSWCSTQRLKTKSLTPERKQRLNDIGFIWDSSKDTT